ncbi:hypothetical protein ACJX0J_036645, partial [Zea mays]
IVFDNIVRSPLLFLEILRVLILIFFIFFIVFVNGCPIQTNIQDLSQTPHYEYDSGRYNKFLQQNSNHSCRTAIEDLHAYCQEAAGRNDVLELFMHQLDRLCFNTSIVHIPSKAFIVTTIDIYHDGIIASRNLHNLLSSTFSFNLAENLAEVGLLGPLLRRGGGQR